MIDNLKAFRVQSFSKAAQSSVSILPLQKYSEMFHFCFIKKPAVIDHHKMYMQCWVTASSCSS